MQINLSQNIKNVSNYPKIADKRSYATPVSFCGVDVFERGAVKFSKELCVETINKIFKSESDSEVKSAIETIMALKKVDPGLIELDRLGYKYLDTISKNDKNLETLSLEDKKNLLRHEENMHWEELETPQVGLVRTILDMRNKGIEDDFVPAMQVCTLNGLSKLRAVYHDLGMKITPDEKRFNLLKTLIEDTPDGAPFSTRIKTAALGVSSAVTKDRDSFVELAKYVKETTNDKDLKIYASGCIDSQLKYNELELFDKLSSTDLKDYEKKSVIKMLAYKKSKKLAEQLPSIINDKNTPHEVKIAAVWATGKCQSGENFDLLNKIANNSDTVDLEEREMAIHSLALYLRTNETQVKATLNKVIKEKSDLSELANILLEKCEGRYYSKDKELAHLRDEEKFLYKQSRDKYLTTDFKMNIQQTNIIDRALSKFKKPLAELAGRDAKLYIMKDTCTRAAAEGIGVRHIKKGDPIHSGFFYDSATGMSMPPKLIFVSKKDLKTKDKFNTFAHEFNHAFYRTCLTEGEDKEKLLLLYKNAVEQGRCLDKYAEYTDGEYFAQGHEAYCSVYKPHNAIFDNNDFNDTTCHLRSTLKRKDPELYDFIEHCIKKYGG